MANTALTTARFNQIVLAVQMRSPGYLNLIADYFQCMTAEQKFLIEAANVAAISPTSSVTITPVPVVECGGASVNVTPTQTVAILGTRAPIPVCVTNRRDYDMEVGCASDDGRLLVRTFVINDAGVLTSTLYEQDGTTVAPAGVTMVKCAGDAAVDWENRETLFVNGAGDRFTKVTNYNSATGAAGVVVWFDELGSVVAAPAGVTPWEQPTINSTENHFGSGIIDTTGSGSGITNWSNFKAITIVKMDDTPDTITVATTNGDIVLNLNNRSVSLGASNNLQFETFQLAGITVTPSNLATYQVFGIEA